MRSFHLWHLGYVASLGTADTDILPNPFHQLFILDDFPTLRQLGKLLVLGDSSEWWVCLPQPRALTYLVNLS